MTCRPTLPSDDDDGATSPPARFFGVAVLSSASGAVIACSGVPDITFPPEDAGRDAEDGGKDAGSDVARDTFVPPPAPRPDAAPAGGVCACEDCSASDCTECNAKRCANGDICCARGASMHCTEVGKCN